MVKPSPNRSLLLAGLIMLVLLAQAATGLFALWRADREHGEARATLTGLTEILDGARDAEVAFKVQVQEWKNILLRGNDAALRARHTTSFRAEQQRVREALGRAGADGEALLSNHAEVNAAYDAALAEADLATVDGARATDARVRGVDRALQQALESLSHRLEANYRAANDAASQAAIASYLSLRNTLYISAAIGILAVLGLLVPLLRR
ncbi:hypothetical protein EOD42_15050 [Rhodovarius crocodyli]|uniref:Methyl-accepting chemotaxis protein n=1 Tax=Rhodovarius crocodyli TaxID=1979269 RepID=A0A437MD25_9PROT|nr:hypothetical protein [Rhodovarius crocodyli]RVT95528.1 hypothetical protein EOD42_15050 [Rhodovarius crocodyli]